MLGVPIMTSDTKYYYEKLILFELLRSEKISLNVQKKKGKLYGQHKEENFKTALKTATPTWSTFLTMKDNEHNHQVLFLAAADTNNKHFFFLRENKRI